MGLYLAGNDRLTGCIADELWSIRGHDLRELDLWRCGISESAADRAVLIDFFHTTSGPGWTNNRHWLSEAPIGVWHGVTTNSAGQVTVLRLPRSELFGAIPPVLGRLAHLQTLDLSHNHLRGTIPPELAGLSNLGELRLGSNQLSGPIPPELGRLTNLRTLWLASNQLSGSIPPEFGSLAQLTFLSLDGNQLTGAIPAELAQLANLDDLKLGGSNQFTGCIPAEVARSAVQRPRHAWAAVLLRRRPLAALEASAWISVNATRTPVRPKRIIGCGRLPNRRDIGPVVLAGRSAG